MVFFHETTCWGPQQKKNFDLIEYDQRRTQNDERDRVPSMRNMDCSAWKRKCFEVI